MRDQFLKFIKEKKLFDLKDKLLVAVSGGADSVALCYLLSQLKINFIIAHCNFQLRGEESDEDERSVQDLGETLGVEVFVRQFDTKREAGEKAVSIQMAARNLRYKWFEELRQNYGCKYIVTAHHKSDNTETILLNLTRGTGLSGLHGIKPKNGNIVRPLLLFSKEEILSYLNELKVSFREDSSNSSDKYYRNRIRLKVIPELKKINPSLDDTFENFVEKINSVEDIFEEKVEKFRALRVNRKVDRVEIDATKLKEEKGFLICLFEILKEFEFNFEQCKDLIHSLENQSGKRIESEKSVAIADRGKFIITSKSGKINVSLSIFEDTSVLSTQQFIVNIKKIKRDVDFTIASDKNIAQLDFKKLKFPLLLRSWQDGDVFIPLGMKGKKKLSDYFIDQKVSMADKQNKLVLISEDKITWVVGERIDDRFKITSETTEVFELSLKKNQ